MGRAVRLCGLGVLALLVPAVLLAVLGALAVRGAHGELLQHEATVRPLRGVRGWRSDRLSCQQGTAELRTEGEPGFSLAGAPTRLTRLAVRGMLHSACDLCCIWLVAWRVAARRVACRSIA